MKTEIANKEGTPVKFHPQAYIFTIHFLGTCNTKAVLGDTATRRQLDIETLTFIIFCNNVHDFFQKIVQQFGAGVCEKINRSCLFGLSFFIVDEILYLLEKSI